MSNYVVTDIDKWLVRNKKDVVDLLYKQGKRIEGFDKAKYNAIIDLWNSVEHTTNTVDKLKKWNDLQEKLGGIFNDAEKTVKSYDVQISKFKENPNFNGLQGASKDKYDFWSKLNSIGQSRPDIGDEELKNLDLGDVFKYNNKQLKKLAADYGYNYDDPEDRKEFIKQAGEYSRQKELDRIWAEDVYTSVVSPIAKEYARNNYDKIKERSDLVPALGADYLTNLFMAKAPGFTNVIVPPVIRQGARNIINDVPVEDAAKTTLTEITTNVATPFALRGAFRWGNRAKQQAVQKAEEELIDTSEKAVEKAAAKLANKDINSIADEVGEIQRKLKNGGVYQDNNGALWKFSKKGNKEQASELDAYTAEKAGRFIDNNKYKFYLANKKALRGKQWGPEGNDIEKEIDNRVQNYIKLDPETFSNTPEKIKDTFKEEYKTSLIGKMRDNLINKRPTTNGMTAEELSVIANIKPKEGKLNFLQRNANEKIKNVAESENLNALSKDIKSLITNMQGRTKYTGPVFTSVGQLIPGYDGKISLEERKIPTEYSDADLIKFKRMNTLHNLYPDMFPEPQLPEKYKDFSIQEIFGE